MNFKEIQRLYIFLSRFSIHPFQVNRIHQPSGPNCCQFEAKKSSFPSFFFSRFLFCFLNQNFLAILRKRDLFGMVMVIRDPLKMVKYK